MRAVTVARGLWVLVLVTAVLGLAAPPAAAAPSASVREAQTILTKLGIPIGPVDGVYGPQTGRGLCAFRYLSGESPSRANVTSALLTKLRAYDAAYSALSKIPAPARDGRDTYLVAHEHCQAMLYVADRRYRRVMAISTGATGFGTPNGSYSLGGTKRGWHCSTSYPESCRTQTSGRFAAISDFGNMYNRRFFRASGYYVHGSTSVPTYPASHGCVRVTVSDSDWMYDHVGNDGPTYFAVVSSY